jgi:hypothetical protein
MVMIRNFCLLQQDGQLQVVHPGGRIRRGAVRLQVFKAGDQVHAPDIKSIGHPFGTGNIVRPERIIGHDAVRFKNQVTVFPGDQAGLCEILFQEFVQREGGLQGFVFGGKGQVGLADQEVGRVGKADQDGRDDHYDHGFHDRKSREFSRCCFHC